MPTDYMRQVKKVFFSLFPYQARSGSDALSGLHRPQSGVDHEGGVRREGQDGPGHARGYRDPQALRIRPRDRPQAPLLLEDQDSIAKGEKSDEKLSYQIYINCSKNRKLITKKKIQLSGLRGSDLRP